MQGDINNSNNMSSPSPTPVPSTVEAVKNLERRKLFAENAVGTITQSPPPPRAPLANLTKRLITVGGVLVGCLVVLGIIMFTGLDTQVIKLTLIGAVLDNNDQPIKAAKVQLGEDMAETDQNGKYSFGGLTAGSYRVKISAPGFKAVDESLSLSRNNFNYTVIRNYKLEPEGRGFFSGKLKVTDNPNYRFSDEKVVIDKVKYQVNPDGSFTLPEMDTGTYDITITSPNYMDVELKGTELKSLETKLNIDTLKPAGDITGKLLSYLTEDTVLDGQLTIEGVLQSNLEVGDQGDFIFKDLEPGKTYKLRTSATGYNTRDYEVKITQGVNKLVSFRFVEQGLVAYLSQRNGFLDLYVSDYDGKNEQKLTDKQYNPFGIDLIDDQQHAVFASRIGGKIDFFSVPTAAGNPQNLTQDVESKFLLQAIPNYAAQKFTSSYNDDITRENTLDVRSINGSGKVKIASTKGSFVDVKLSDNGNFVAYLINNRNQPDNGFYRTNVNTSETRKVNSDNVTSIFSISGDGNRILYAALDSSTNKTALKYSDLTKGETVTVANSADGEFYQFVKGSNSLILYTSLRDGRNDIYRYNIETRAEEALTKQGAVESILQQGDKLLYYTANGLFVIELAKPVEGKLVTNTETRYTGYIN